jgi:NADPH-dependent 2,4-dienoyl-CoA reductase/sulfur reductase-like enzyme
LYLKRHKPKAKLLILDANGGIVSKKALFSDAWQKHYASIIEYLPSNALETVDVKTLTVESAFDSIQADVLNIIPPQKAGKVAELAGVVNRDKRWCEVDFTSYESTVKKEIHVIGDAVASTLPKSGHIANMQAKVCAAAISAILQDQVPEQMPVFGNTCYSFVSDREAGHVAAVFRYNAEQKNMVVMPGGGASKVGSESEARFAYAWAANIWSDTLE